MVTSLGCLYRRRVYLNMVAGGFKNDLAALNDTTPHDKRYERLVEYTTIIRRLLAGASAVTRRGEFYTVDKLRLTPPLAADLYRASSCPGPRTPGWRRRARSAPPPFITRSRRRRTRLRLSSRPARPASGWGSSRASGRRTPGARPTRGSRRTESASSPISSP